MPGAPHRRGASDPSNSPFRIQGRLTLTMPWRARPQSFFHAFTII
jgi:hypothetical protein